MSVDVHSHGTEDGPGWACHELLLTNGQKIGACQIRDHLRMAWDKGFSAGERDYAGHVTFDEPCIPNPYAEES